MLAFLFGGGAILFGIQHALMQRTVVRNAKDTARRIANDQAAIINIRLQKLTPVAEGIAADLTSGALKPDDVSARLRKALEEYPDLFEAGIAYVPNSKAPDVRLLTYNIRYGGVGRVGALASVIAECAPDLVILQEAIRPSVVAQLASATGMTSWAAQAAHSVAFMSRREVAHYEWHRPPASRRAFLELVLAGGGLRVFGVHLSAVHSNWTERRRVRELRAVLAGIAEHQHGFHVVTGDFNTIAPGETLDIQKLPPRLRAFVYLTGRTIRWETIQIMLDAAYADGYRMLHPDRPGFTFPTWDPHIRLDYLFVPRDAVDVLRSCVVLDGPQVKSASDHLPLLAEVDAP